METPSTGIEDAIKAAGNQANLGKALGVTQQTVSLWLKAGYVPNDHVVPIEAQFGIPRGRLINPRFAALIDSPTDTEGGAL